MVRITPKPLGCLSFPSTSQTFPLPILKTPLGHLQKHEHCMFSSATAPLLLPVIQFIYPDHLAFLQLIFVGINAAKKVFEREISHHGQVCDFFFECWKLHIGSYCWKSHKHKTKREGRVEVSKVDALLLCNDNEKSKQIPLENGVTADKVDSS